MKSTVDDVVVVNGIVPHRLLMILDGDDNNMIRKN